MNLKDYIKYVICGWKELKERRRFTKLHANAGASAQELCKRYKEKFGTTLGIYKTKDKQYTYLKKLADWEVEDNLN